MVYCYNENCSEQLRDCDEGLECDDCFAKSLEDDYPCDPDLAYAEDGGGSEMANDLWAERVYGGQ